MICMKVIVYTYNYLELHEVVYSITYIMVSSNYVYIYICVYICILINYKHCSKRLFNKRLQRC